LGLNVIDELPETIGFDGEDVSDFSVGSSVAFDLHSFEVGIGGLDVLFLLCDKFSEFSRVFHTPRFGGNYCGEAGR
jgi:hypothetical protein